MQVIAQQGDSVDSLCWRHLGSTDAVEPTLELNPGLAALGAVLPMGTKVTLPDTAPVATNKNLIQLWD
jgi:phage tail protein X